MPDVVNWLGLFESNFSRLDNVVVIDYAQIQLKLK